MSAAAASIFADDLARNLDAADAVYNGICGLIDKHIAESRIAAPPGAPYAPVWHPAAVPADLDPVAAGITSVVWATGFTADWSWVDLGNYGDSLLNSSSRRIP